MHTKVLKKIGGLGIVICGLIFFIKAFDLNKVAHLSFGSYHAWRQADCISLTNNFYDGESSLINPTTNFTKDDGTRLAAGEFPLINYLVAKLYKVFGKSDATYRWTIFLFYIIALIFLFLLFFEVSGHTLFSSLMTLLLGSGSILLYYAINFLPDVPALSFAIVGFYWITIAKRQKRIGLYGLGIVAILLAALLKLTFAMVLMSVAVVLMVEMVMHGRKRFNLQALGLIFISFVLLCCWYRHAYLLDHKHPPFVFLTETRSYFQTYVTERPLIWHEVVHRWLPQVYLPVVWIFILGGGLVSIFASTKTKIEQVLLLSLILLFSVVFFIMMYRQFMLHDYLWIGLLMTPILLAMLLVQSLAAIRVQLVRQSILLFMGILLVLQGFQTKLMLKERYMKFDNAWLYNPSLGELKKELREHGIKKTDLVISIPDPSPNITLTVLDQYGFTNYRGANMDSLGIVASIKKGAQYLVVTNEKEFERSYLKSFFKYYIFDYKKMAVFDLRPFGRR